MCCQEKLGLHAPHIKALIYCLLLSAREKQKYIHVCITKKLL